MIEKDVNARMHIIITN